MNPVYAVIGSIVAGLLGPVESTAPPVPPPAPPRIVVVSSDYAPTTTITTIHIPTATPEPTATPRPKPTAPAINRKSGPMPYVETKLGDHVPARIKKYEPLIQKHARTYDVDPNFVAAVIMTESSGNPNAVSPKNAVGLMQVLDGPSDPDANIKEGTAIIGKWLRYYGSVDIAIAAYNAGPGNVKKHGGIPPFAETHKHISRTLANYASYSVGTA